MQGLVSFLKERCFINDFDTHDKIAVMKHMFAYFLGLQKYQASYKALQEFGLHRTFSSCIRLLQEDQIKYIIFKLRKQAKRLRQVRYVGVKADDYLWLKKLKNCLDYSQIQLIKRYPSIGKVIHNTKPHIINVATRMYNSCRVDSSICRDDIISELQWKIAQAYKIYIYSYGMGNFNRKVFYSCLLKGVVTRKLDIVQSMFKDKRVTSIFSQSMDGIEDCLKHSTESAEEIYMANLAGNCLLHHFVLGEGQCAPHPI